MRTYTAVYTQKGVQFTRQFQADDLPHAARQAKREETEPEKLETVTHLPVSLLKRAESCLSNLVDRDLIAGDGDHMQEVQDLLSELQKRTI